MNTLQKINKAKQDTAKEILEELYNNIFTVDILDNEDVYNNMEKYINKEYLFKSDYI